MKFFIATFIAIFMLSCGETKTAMHSSRSAGLTTATAGNNNDADGTGTGSGNNSGGTTTPPPAGTGNNNSAGSDAVKPGTPAPVGNFEVIKESGINFCTAAGANLVLDLARPKNAPGNLPGIVFVHGGGWTTGSRASFGDDIALAAKRGYVAITIEYRLTGALMPGQIEDVKCAVRWLKSKAAMYKVDKNRIGIFGMSAGAHLSMLAAFSDVGQFEGSGGHATESSKVFAVVNWYGPSDMADLYAFVPAQKKAAFQVMFGGTPASKPDAYRDASPLTYASAGDPPVRTYHGTTDGTVPVRQADMLDAKLNSVGVAHTLTKLQGEGHGFSPSVYTNAQLGSLDFLDTYLRTQ